MTSRNQPISELEISSSPQRDLILRAAARLFRKRGYDRTTVRELADAVGLQSGSLFHHFKTKDEILVAVMEHGLVLASAFVISATAQAKTPRERVETLFRSYLVALLSDEYRDYMTVLLYDFRSLSPALAQRVHQLRSEVERRWLAVLNEVLPAGQPGPSVRLKTQFVLGAMNWALQWYNPKGKLSLDELSQQFAELALTTCGLGTKADDQLVPSELASENTH